jgi:glycosyltransferase involved in cell wall biosynthesis
MNPAAIPSAGPRIGVLINNYNNGPWLRACVDSVLAQTRPPDEIIVYDDGSTDDSLAILRSYGDRLRLIEGVHDQSRPGIVSQGAALAGAFAASTADHLYLLDGDDCFLPDKIRRYEAAWAARPEAVLVQAPMLLIDEAGRVLRDNYEANKHRTDHRRATYRQQDCDLYYATSALAFQRAYLAREVPIDYSVIRDAPIDARLTASVALFGPVLTLEEPLSCWRQRGGSISRAAGQRDPLAATIRRNRCFNHVARRHGHPPIRLWLNRRFYRQLARRLLPSALAARLARNPEGRRPAA